MHVQTTGFPFFEKEMSKKGTMLFGFIFCRITDQSENTTEQKTVHLLVLVEEPYLSYIHSAL